MPASNPWSRRFRRLLVFGTTASTFYLISSYILDRLRETRVKALKERQERDLLKSHFTSLMSTISFTLYALLPNLQPQLSDAYPVESTSQALRGMSASTVSSSQVSVEVTPESSMILQGPQGSDVGQIETQASPVKSGNGASAVGESWASEFRRRDIESEPSLLGSTMQPGTESESPVSPTFSQSISLPPTDTSSVSPSPESDVSRNALLHASPPTLQAASSVPGKSKKELWRDLKQQTLTRSLTTAYLVPLLYLLTSSQLSILARLRYLSDVKSTLPFPATPPNHGTPRTSGWLDYFSVSSMGLSAFADSATSFLPQIPLFSRPVSASPQHNTAITVVEDIKAETEAQRAEAERMFLTYSWWVLHEGWKDVAVRVEESVERVFGGMALKRGISAEDWEGLIKDVRASVETGSSLDRIELYDFTPHLIPPSPLPPSSPDCPLVTDLSSAHPHLVSLLSETATHMSSSDSRYLLDKGVSAMLIKLRDELYRSPGEGQRMVDCLPMVDRWGKGVWEGLPDSGVEAVLALPEFEGFAALVFGDWAPRD